MDLDQILNTYQSYVGRKNADDVVKEQDATLKAIDKVSAFAGLLDGIRTAYGLIADTTTGRYRGVPKTTIALIVGGLAYLALPVDIVPDFIPVAGWLDDAAVLAWIFRQSTDELERYRTWRRETATVLR